MSTDKQRPETTALALKSGGVFTTAPKPCPLCGAEPRAGMNRATDETGEQYGYAFIECQVGDHFCGVHADTLDEALEQWNKRPVA